MLSKISKLTGWEALVRYAKTTSVFRKIIDVLLLCLLLIAYGIATGHVDLSKYISHHTVERSYVQSDKVQQVLRKTQYENQYSFIGHFRFHNGVSSLNGSYSFTKFSLTEYISKPYITVNVMEWKDLPMALDFYMMAALYSGECYSKNIGYNDPLYNQYMRMNVDSIVACPVYDSKGKLSGILMAGTNSHNKVEKSVIASTVKSLEGM